MRLVDLIKANMEDQASAEAARQQPGLALTSHPPTPDSSPSARTSVRR